MSAAVATMNPLSVGFPATIRRPRQARSTVRRDSLRTVSNAADDLALVERARQGEHAAFQILAERHGRDAYHLARRIVGNHEDAEEVVQEALLKAYRKLDRFRGGSKFYTWLYRIVYNESIDRVRKVGRNKAVDYDDAIGRHDEAAGSSELLPPRMDADPELVQRRRELKEQMETALAQLSEPHQAVIVLREVKGLTYEEIAEVVGCPKGTVMSRLHHARKQMQSLLAPYRRQGTAVSSTPVGSPVLAAGMDE